MLIDGSVLQVNVTAHFGAPTAPFTGLTTASTSTSASEPGSNTVTIVGIVVGMVGGLLLLGLAAWFCIRRSKTKSATAAAAATAAPTPGGTGHVQPYMQHPQTFPRQQQYQEPPMYLAQSQQMKDVDPRHTPMQPPGELPEDYVRYEVA
ncbi:hypothetical protein BZA05DRAFT_440476 [Tricharina praecox]|uniref:uncharacterized protein n=1 Tax=Tricharina praecox TaxID=43433 RepID=UPI0022204967|nr:uncharacterized protein BZA05DRAFT_440476 [Tricharina praecox]KAI5858860.1 hypothetical protein BZA05DRAFT_440476 [Tricharina praecox]